MKTQVEKIKILSALVAEINSVIKDTDAHFQLSQIQIEDTPCASEFVKFYADTPSGDKNKLFTFKTTLPDLERCLIRFILKGYYIRSAWYHVRQPTGEIIENTRITTIPFIIDKILSMSKYELQNYLK